MRRFPTGSSRSAPAMSRPRKNTPPRSTGSTPAEPLALSAERPIGAALGRPRSRRAHLPRHGRPRRHQAARPAWPVRRSASPQRSRQRAGLCRGSRAHRAVARLGEPRRAGGALQGRRLGRRARFARGQCADARQRHLSPAARGAAHRARPRLGRHRSRPRQGDGARSTETGADFGAGGFARRAAPRRRRPAAQSVPHHRQGLARQSASRIGAGL